MPEGDLDPADRGALDPAADADLYMAAASLRADHRELQALLVALVDSLEGLRGVQLRAEYERGRLGKIIGDIPYVNPRTHAVRSIEVIVGPDEFRLEADGSLRCAVAPVTEAAVASGWRTLSLSEWAQALLAAVDAQAGATAAAVKPSSSSSG